MDFDIYVRFNKHRIVHPYPLSSTRKSVIIGIDSSKSNTAIYIENLKDFSIEGCVEITIPSHISVKDGCRQIRTWLRVLLSNYDVKHVFIEDIVTVRRKDKSNEVYKDNHIVRKILTFIYTNYIVYFQDNHNIDPIDLSQSWKTILGQYNKQNIKGSKLLLQSVQHPLSDYSDDVTDAYMLTQYAKQQFNITKSVTVISSLNPVLRYDTDMQILKVKDVPRNEINQFYNITCDFNLSLLQSTITNIQNDYEVALVKVYTHQLPKVDIERYSIDMSEPFYYIRITGKEN